MHFPSRSSLIIPTLTLLLLSACGPTKVGMVHRAEAKDRMDLVNAQLGYDQAAKSFEAGQFEKALQEINLAVERYPKESAFYLLKGRILLETHQLEPAAEAFLSAQEYDPDSHAAHYYAGIVYQRWSDDEEAFAQYQKASELDETNAQYLLATAESLITLHRFEAARNLIAPRLNFFEHNAAIHQLLGQIALLENDHATAANEYQQAHLLRPDDQVLTRELVRIQYDAGEYQQCLNSIGRMKQTEDNDQNEILHIKAQCLFMVGRTEESRRQYLELSRRDPADPNIWSELGAVAWELEDYQRVALCSTRLLALAPLRFEGHLLRGINEQHHQNNEQAVRSFQRAAELSGDSPLPHLQLGWALEEMGRNEDALLAYGHALERNPDHREARSLYDKLNSRIQVTAVTRK